MAGDKTEALLLWTDTRPTDAEMAKLKAAKRATGVNTPVLPRRAFPGCGGRFIAIGARPPWLADYAYVDSYDDPRLSKALKWVLLGDEVLGEIPGPVRLIDQLRDVFGPGVKEVVPDDAVW